MDTVATDCLTVNVNGIAVPVFIRSIRKAAKGQGEAGKIILHSTAGIGQLYRGKLGDFVTIQLQPNIVGNRVFAVCQGSAGLDLQGVYTAETGCSRHILLDSAVVQQKGKIGAQMQVMYAITADFLAVDIHGVVVPVFIRSICQAFKIQQVSALTILCSTAFEG